MSSFERPPVPSGVHCASCGYDLSGSMVGGQCPECGAPVAQSVRPMAAGAGQPSGLAVASMVLGIVSIPGLGCYCAPGVVCAVLAVIFGLMVRKQIARGEADPSSRGMALAGLICGLVSLALFTVIVLMYAVFIIVAVSSGP